jgi:phosphoribosyl 1,2-cyclic phosphodiesterase
MRLTFLGVRGSFPSPSPATRRYGGNTAAVALHVDGEPPILLDLGTGLPHLDASIGRADGEPFRATALVTHMHLDHVQGLPFFPPVHQTGTVLDVYGPRQDTGSLRDAFARLVDPPYFPLPLDQILGDIRFHEVCDDEFAIGRATVMVRPVPHLGPTVGYRISWDGGTVAYISDHQAPRDFDHVDTAVLELCDGVDLLIHEGQYTRREFPAKADWGHCTIDYALRVAIQAGARRLCVFHHDPWRSDDELDALVAEAQAAVAGATEEVMAASEGLTLTVSGR